MVDESIKLFSISKKIVETIFDAESEDQREYYVVLVPCVVNGIGNKRFIVRKNLDKLVRQYLVRFFLSLEKPYRGLGAKFYLKIC